MTNKETITRNIGLTFDFVNYLIDNPSLIDKFSDRFKLEFIEKDFSNIEKAEEPSVDSQWTRKIVLVRNSFQLAE
jgi:hypothetical protein